VVEFRVSPILALLLQIIVIVAAARLVGAAFRRFGQAPVVGEMFAGLLLGPSLFGALAPATSAWLFPPASLELLSALSQFGLVLFMLLVGLHLDSTALRANSRLVLATSYTSMLLPFALGVGLALPLARQFDVAAAARLPFMLFVGLSLSITAFPVLVRIVGAHHLSATRLGTVAIACAAFDDVTAWIALAVVTSLVHAENALTLTPLLWLAVYAATMLIVVRPLLRRMLQRVDHDDTRFTVVLVAALASAAATEWIGIHPLFGSFFLGALVARDVGRAELFTARIEPLALAVFLPLFFAFTGLRTNVFLLTSPWLIAEAVIILAVAILGKAAGPLLLGPRLGFERREAIALAALLNTRGLVELVVLNIGLERGLLPPTLFAMLMMMALLTTAMTSPLLRRLGYPTGVHNEVVRSARL
jgi:Kef-type K+ transport system membrane component KefB